MELKPIKDLSEEELFTFFESNCEKKYRFNQIQNALYQKKIHSFSEINNFPAKLISQLNSTFTVHSLKIEEVFESIDGTKKILFKTNDLQYIETVFLPNNQNDNTKKNNIHSKNNSSHSNNINDSAEKRNTLCISTMIGCPINCSFCATGYLGFKRNLSISEIIDQIFLVNNIINEGSANNTNNINNIVFMGMGEPFLNYENVVDTIKLITKNNLLNKRSITVSTVGIPEKIIDFANEEIKPKLAISLHSPDDKIRQNLVPISKTYSIEKLLKSLDYYYSCSKLPITFEYILFKGINDRDEDIKKLSRIARRFPSKVNLIPFNDISFIAQNSLISDNYKETNYEDIVNFSRKLYDAGTRVIIRKSQGADIAAACGQLAIYKKHSDFI